MRLVIKDELPTIFLLVATYASFFVVTSFSSVLGSVLTIAGLALIVTLYSSLQHEVLHGHPFRNQRLNDALVFPAIGLFIPYRRFKDTHLAHHFDPNLTDPYEDPETNYLDIAMWETMPSWRRKLAHLNTTLLGRITIGPLISMSAFYRDDLHAIRAGELSLVRDYALHFAGLIIVLAWVGSVGDMPIWQYTIGAYCGMSILKIRTFLEHRAHERTAARSVIIEDRGLLALLFLNNNYHSVHHAHPQVSWHKLPALFESKREHFLRMNAGYTFRSYGNVFRSYLLTPKDGPTHPLWSKQPDLLERGDV